MREYNSPGSGSLGKEHTRIVPDSECPGSNIRGTRSGSEFLSNPKICSFTIDPSKVPYRSSTKIEAPKNMKDKPAIISVFN